jgi:hypothetical protein
MPVGGPVGSAVTGGAGSGVTGAVGSAVTGAVHHVVGSVLGVGAAAVFTAAGQWVASGAVWLLGQVGGAMSATTTVQLSSGWFSAHLSVMATVAAAVVLPMVLCATIQALYRQSASVFVRCFLVNLPLALLFTGVAVELVQMALAVTDTLSAQVLSSSGADTTNILAPVSDVLAGASVFAPGVPEFVVFIGGLLVAVCSLVLWLELVVRAAAVSVAVLFLPLALAALVWPAVSHWCRRLAETLAALVLSKLVIAATLSLAVGALAGGLDAGATGGNGGGFAAVVTGIALLAIATFSPFTLLKLIPAVEAGAVSHLESTRHRLASAAHGPLRARNTAIEIAQAAGWGSAGGPAGAFAASVLGLGTVGGSSSISMVPGMALAIGEDAKSSPHDADADADAGAGAGAGAGDVSSTSASSQASPNATSPAVRSLADTTSPPEPPSSGSTDGASPPSAGRRGTDE